ncbi:MAG: hypothetical protein ACTS3R_08665 [Inquilinaceae bacterium]
MTDIGWPAQTFDRRPLSGTRFRLFPQMPMPGSLAEPETVTLPLPPWAIGPGPSDAVIRVADAVFKSRPYAFPDMPPYRGPVRPPVRPGPDGHFDRIPVGGRDFLAAHIYGSTRFTLGIWENYLGRPIGWYRPGSGMRVELVPMVDWDNAHAGFGFIETGVRHNAAGAPQPFALNFDVLAHEVAHTILFSELGTPPPGAVSAEFLAFHESMSDVVALISALHFDGILDRLIDQTDGNLYVLNWLNRIGELSDTEQIRLASNEVRMADVAGLGLGADGSWVDPTGAGRTVHHLSQPLTGALFDTLVEIYQDGLARRGIIDPTLDPRGWSRETVEQRSADLQRASRSALRWHRAAMLDTLREARDALGRILARTWDRLDIAHFTFADMAAAFQVSAAELGQGHNLMAFAENFLWRGIDPALGTALRAVRHPTPPTALPYAIRVARRHVMNRERAAVPARPEDLAGLLDHGFRAES